MEKQNRTIVCSVLFLDIVEYSQRPVSEQMRQKQRFNDLLAQALVRVPADDRIVLDTGDGAAVSFLGNPEDALFAAMSLRDALQASAGGPAALDVRIGINLGPVRMIKDLNGQLNIIGDGINVAQRVMSFTDPGDIFISRSYFEVVSRLSPEFSQLFQYVGARTDKHVREHEVYSVGPTSQELRAAVPHSSVSAARAPARFNRRLFVVLPFCMAVIIASGAVVRLMKSHGTGPELSATPIKPASPSRSGKGEASPAGQVARADSMQVRLAVLPWGEVYVDGRQRGVSPPLRVLELSPGPHTIEVRNSTFPAFTRKIEARAGETITIRHRFN
jgi:class 3 adenylate cyclase